MTVKYYSYFFTRQDISVEQQIVQTAHVALKLGVEARSTMRDLDEIPENEVKHVSARIDPDNTYFTVIGVRNEDALLAVKDIIDKFAYRYEMFIEPDLQNSITSIALYPVAEYDRGPLLAFDLLKVLKSS